jgi:hypothetical protein
METTNTQNSLTLNMVQTPFISLTFKEVIDWKLVVKLLMNDNILRTTKVQTKHGNTLCFENERKQIIELLKKGCRFSKTRKEIDQAVSNGNINKILPRLFHHTDKYMETTLDVKYFYDKKKPVGRVYPEQSLSLCSFRRSIRHLLANQFYIDIDMVNAHFKIADELFNKETIKFPILHDYVIRRDNYLQLLCDHINPDLSLYTDRRINIITDYDELKECFLRILYFGQYKSWLSDNGFPPTDPPRFITEMINEFQSIADIIKLNNPQLVQYVDANCDNEKGSIVSWFLQDWERQILEQAYNFLNKKSKQIVRNNCVLCFDGIMILQNKNNTDEDFMNTLLTKITDYIQTAMGINVIFKHKVFDRLEYVDELTKMEIEPCEDGVVIIEDHDDKEAANIIYDRLLKNRLVYCNGDYYFKTDNVWIWEFNKVKEYLLQLILESNIYTMTSGKNAQMKCYCQSVSNAKNIISAILSYAVTIPNDKLYQKFHETTRGKICFADGVLFLKDKCFKLWSDSYFQEEIDGVKINEVYTTIIINRRFKPCWDNRNTDSMISYKNTVKQDLFEKILGEQTTKMLQQLSRAMGGYFQDKDWSLWIGERNCGKGCINELLVSTFEKYIFNLPSNCLLQSKFANKDTKENSWMIDLQYPRITLVQEFKKDNEKNGGIRVDGVAIKSICSGGDPQLARKNFQDEIQFIIGTKIFIMCNDMPKIEPVDCLETCIQYNSGMKFKSKAFIENRRKEIENQIKDITDINISNSILSEMDTFLEADDAIKDKCRSVSWNDAFVLLLMDNFVHSKLEPSNDSELKEGNFNIENSLNEHLLFKQSDDCRLSNDRLKTILGEMNINISFQKFKNILMSRGCCEYRTGSTRGLKYIKEIITPVTPDV